MLAAHFPCKSRMVPITSFHAPPSTKLVDSWLPCRRVQGTSMTTSREPPLRVHSARHRRRLPDRGAQLRPALDDGLLPHADVERARLGPRDLRARHRHPEPRLGHRPAFRRHARRQVRHGAGADRRRAPLRPRPRADGADHRPGDAATHRRRPHRPRHRRLGVPAGPRRLRAAPPRAHADHRPTGSARPPARLGQFIFAPLGQGFIQAYGWQTALIVMAAIVLAHPAVLALRHPRQADGRRRSRRAEGPVDPRGAPRGLPPPLLPAARRRLLRLRLPDRLHHRPPAALSQRHRHPGDLWRLRDRR